MNSTNDHLFVVVAVVLTFAVGMATFLNYSKFESLVGKLMRSRVSVIGNEVRDNVEKSLALGLSLQENNTIQGLIERELRADDLIKSIVLFDTAGTVLYATESERLGATVAKGWLKASAMPRTDTWFVTEQNAFVAGITLKNNFGITLGHVALSYTKKPLERCMGIMGNILLQTALGVLMVTVIAAFSLLALSFRQYRKELLAAEGHLTILVKDLDGTPHRMEPDETESTSPFLQQIREFVQSVRSTATEIDRVTGSLKPPSSTT